jgi:hypothetical protein
VKYAVFLTYGYLEGSTSDSEGYEARSTLESFSFAFELLTFSFAYETFSIRQAIQFVYRTNNGVQSCMSGMSQWTETIYPTDWKNRYGIT